MFVPVQYRLSLYKYQCFLKLAEDLDLFSTGAGVAQVRRCPLIEKSRVSGGLVLSFILDTLLEV